MPVNRATLTHVIVALLAVTHMLSGIAIAQEPAGGTTRGVFENNGDMTCSIRLYEIASGDVIGMQALISPSGIELGSDFIDIGSEPRSRFTVEPDHIDGEDESVEIRVRIPLTLAVEPGIYNARFIVSKAGQANSGSPPRPPIAVRLIRPDPRLEVQSGATRRVVLHRWWPWVSASGATTVTLAETTGSAAVPNIAVVTELEPEASPGIVPKPRVPTGEGEVLPPKGARAWNVELSGFDRPTEYTATLKWRATASSSVPTSTVTVAVRDRWPVPLLFLTIGIFLSVYVRKLVVERLPFLRFRLEMRVLRERLTQEFELTRSDSPADRVLRELEIQFGEATTKWWIGKRDGARALLAKISNELTDYREAQDKRADELRGQLEAFNERLERYTDAWLTTIPELPDKIAGLRVRLRAIEGNRRARLLDQAEDELSILENDENVLRKVVAEQLLKTLVASLESLREKVKDAEKLLNEAGQHLEAGAIENAWDILDRIAEVFFARPAASAAEIAADVPFETGNIEQGEPLPDLVGEIKRAERNLMIVAGLVTVCTGMVTLYFGDGSFGTPAQYIGLLLWGFGVDAGLKGYTSVYGALTASR